MTVYVGILFWCHLSLLESPEGIRAWGTKSVLKRTKRGLTYSSSAACNLLTRH